MEREQKKSKDRHSFQSSVKSPKQVSIAIDAPSAENVILAPGKFPSESVMFMSFTVAHRLPPRQQHNV